MASSDKDNSNKSAAELEREVNRERAKVADTIDALQDRVSVGGIVDQVMKTVSDHGGDMGRNLGQTIKNNPIPLALTGIGLAWLIASSGRSDDDYRSSGRSYASSDDPYRAGPYDDGFHESAAYPPTRTGAPTGPDGTPPTYATATAAPPPSTAAGSTTGSSSSTSAGIKDAVSERASAAKDAAASARDTVADRAASARDSVAGGAASARDSVAGRAAAARDSAAYHADAAGAAVRDHAQRAGDAASNAADAARHHAAIAGDRAAQAGCSAKDGFDRLLDEQPLVVGALALAVGAAIGGALPRTRREDEMLGEHRDRLMDQAEAAARDQAAKGRAVAERVMEESQSVADEAAGEADRKTPDGGSMVDKAEQKVRETGERLKSAAVDEADKQNLGKVETSGSTSNPNRKV